VAQAAHATSVLFALLLAVATPVLADHTPGHDTPGEARLVTLPEPDIFAMAPMRDGIKLATYVLLPEGDGPFPTVLVRSIYKDGVIPWGAYGHDKFLASGYAYVFQSTRGSGASEGVYRFIADDRNDGFDTVEWVAEQPWSDGNIGMNNGSYLGMTQLAAAATKPPNLKAIIPHVPSADYFRETPYSGGIFMRYHMLNWHKLISISSREELGVGFMNPALVMQDEAMLERLMRRPLLDSADGYLFGDRLDQYKAFIRHSRFGSYWRDLQNMPEDYAKMDVPTLLIGGNFDLGIGVLAAWKGLDAHAPNRAQRHLLIGPWTHGQSYHAGVTGNSLYEFGEQALVDMDALRIAFLDRYLKGAAVDDTLPKRVKLFVTGSNLWREFDAFPVLEANEVKMFLASDGQANSVQGDGVLDFSASSGAPDTMTNDPREPIVVQTELATGISFYHETERRPNVLVYTSEALAAPLTIIGEPSIHLHVSADAPDADVMVRLTEVYPDGRSVALGFGANLRLRYREGFDKEVLLEPGEIYALDMPLTYIGHTIPAGHRLRINILGTEFPLYDPNPNTGEPIATATRVQKARVTVHHDEVMPSYLTLPVVDL